MIAPQHFSAGQVLEAGRRAAAIGNRDYARQFFVHVLQNYPATAEAAAAHEAIQRLDAQHGAPSSAAELGAGRMASAPLNSASLEGVPATLPLYPPQRPFPVAASHGPEPRQASPERPPHPAAQAHGAPIGFGTFRPETPTVATPEAQRQRSASRTARSSRRRPARHAEEDHRAAVDDAPSTYRLGRFTARIVSIIGGLALIGGVTAIVADLALLLVGKPNALPAAAAASPLLAAAFVLAALVLILLGQIATATFAIAAASKATPSDHTDA